jgi:hypothetical protein
MILKQTTSLKRNLTEDGALDLLAHWGHQESKDD